MSLQRAGEAVTVTAGFACKLMSSNLSHYTHVLYLPATKHLLLLNKHEAPLAVPTKWMCATTYCPQT